MPIAISGLLILVAVIHLLPVSGVLSPERLSALYDLSFQEPNLAILMRHRAVMFGLLGLFILYAAFKPELQPLALIAGFVSVIAFLFIAWSTGEYNPAVRKVVIADIIALISLCIATVLYLIHHKV